MATGAFVPAQSSIRSDGKTATLRFDQPGSNLWDVNLLLIEDPEKCVSFLVGRNTDSERTVKAIDIEVYPVDAGDNAIDIVLALDGYIQTGENVEIFVVDNPDNSVAFIRDGGLSEDQSGESITTSFGGEAFGEVITNSSTFVGLAALSDLKSNLGVTTSTDDEFMANLLRVATRRIEVYCGRDRGGFISQSWTETIDGDGTGEIALRNRPVTAITSVKSIDSEGTETTLDSSAYRRDQRVGIVHRIDDEDSDLGFISGGGGHNGIVFRWPAQFERGDQNLSVTYTGGYTPSNLPEDLQWAAIQIASDLYRAKKIDGNLASESIGQHSYSLRTPTERSEEFERLLAPYVRWTIA